MAHRMPVDDSPSKFPCHICHKVTNKLDEALNCPAAHICSDKCRWTYYVNNLFVDPDNEAEIWEHMKLKGYTEAYILKEILHESTTEGPAALHDEGKEIAPEEGLDSGRNGLKQGILSLGSNPSSNENIDVRARSEDENHTMAIRPSN